ELGRTYLWQRDFSSARGHSERAALLDPSDVQATYLLAWSWLAQDSVPKAREILLKTMARMGAVGYLTGMLNTSEEWFFRYFHPELGAALKRLAKPPGLGEPGRYYLAKGRLYEQSNQEIARVYFDSLRTIEEQRNVQRSPNPREQMVLALAYAA